MTGKLTVRAHTFHRSDDTPVLRPTVLSTVTISTYFNVEN